MNEQEPQKLTLEEAHVMLSKQASQIAQMNYDNALLGVRLQAAVERNAELEAKLEGANKPSTDSKAK